jgi:hypothetical protein
MAKFAAIAAVAALLATLGCDPKPAKPSTDWQKHADSMDWIWDAREANLLFCVRREFDDYQVEIISLKSGKAGLEKSLTVRVTDGDKEVYSFKAREDTVFTRRGDLLYFAEFNPITTGCSVVAYDFKAKKQLWKTDLKGLGPIDHSKYRNEVAISMTNEDVIYVRGNEAGGRYVEFVDAKTGKTVGNKVFK